MTSRVITRAFTAEQQVTGQAACSCINITANCLFVTLGSPPGLRPLGLAHSLAGESPARRHKVCLFSALSGAGLYPRPLAGPTVQQQHMGWKMPRVTCGFHTTLVPGGCFWDLSYAWGHTREPGHGAGGQAASAQVRSQAWGRALRESVSQIHSYVCPGLGQMGHRKARRNMSLRTRVHTCAALTCSVDHPKRHADGQVSSGPPKSIAQGGPEPGNLCQKERTDI